MIGFLTIHNNSIQLPRTQLTRLTLETLEHFISVSKVSLRKKEYEWMFLCCWGGLHVILTWPLSISCNFISRTFPGTSINFISLYLK